MFDGRLQVSEANGDPQQSIGEAESEREEGELVPDGAQPQDSVDVAGMMDMQPDDSLGEPGDAAADIDNDGAIVDIGDPAVEIASPMDDYLQRSTKARSAKWLLLCRSWPLKVYKLHGPAVPVSADGWDAAAAPAPIAAPGLDLAPEPAAPSWE